MAFPKIEEVSTKLMGKSPADLKEFAVKDVPIATEVPAKVLKIVTDKVLKAVQDFVAAGGEYGKKKKYGWRSVVHFITKYTNFIKPVPLKKLAQDQTTDLEKKNIKLDIRLMVTEIESGTSVVFNGAYHPFLSSRKNAVVILVVGVPSRYIVDVGKLPKFEIELIKKAIPNIFRHEVYHAQEYQPKGFVRRLGSMLKRGPATTLHLFREIIRRKGLPANANVAYFRLQDEFRANVSAVADVWKRLKPKEKKGLTLIDLLKSYGDAFNNVGIRDSLIQAYYDDPVYRKAFLKELKKRRVRISEGLNRQVLSKLFPDFNKMKLKERESTFSFIVLSESFIREIIYKGGK